MIVVVDEDSTSSTMSLYINLQILFDIHLIQFYNHYMYEVETICDDDDDDDDIYSSVVRSLGVRGTPICNALCVIDKLLDSSKDFLVSSKDLSK